MKFVYGAVLIICLTSCNITFMEKPAYENADPRKPLIPELSNDEREFECFKLAKLMEVPIRNRDGHWDVLVVHLNGTCKGIKPIRLMEGLR